MILKYDNRGVKIPSVFMATISEISEKVQSFSSGFSSMIENTLQSSSEIISELIQDQLESGLKGNEKPLRPTYTNDPYFKETTKTAKAAKQKAKGYMKWKKRITPPTATILYPARDVDTPNLYIRGDFYASIVTHVSGGIIRIGTEGLSFGNDIEKKYGSVMFKLSPKARYYLLEYKIKPAIKMYMEKYKLI